MVNKKRAKFPSPFPHWDCFFDYRFFFDEVFLAVVFFAAAFFVVFFAAFFTAIYYSPPSCGVMG